MYARSISNAAGQDCLDNTTPCLKRQRATTARQPPVCNIAAHHAGSYAAHVLLTLPQYKPILYGWLCRPARLLPACSSGFRRLRSKDKKPGLSRQRRRSEGEGEKKKSTRRFFSRMAEKPVFLCQGREAKEERRSAKAKKERGRKPPPGNK